MSADEKRLVRDPIDGAWNHPNGKVAVFQSRAGYGWLVAKPEGGLVASELESEAVAVAWAAEHFGYAPPEPEETT